ncbi:F0F1 ATP synthase subunit B [Mesorhizobium comanense]|uniref:F0F1 ATP synthase subunit B n=1 Tax=Mesorhizobium comanense TaxID=2502215 RepID=UPI0010F6B3DE|nr:F0F1 ATP synthase subunit B [Mesorhizobium comanense]
MNATSLATLWVFIALLLFVGILIWAGVPKKLAGTLDGRADRIRKELDEARRLREEAQQLLGLYQKKRNEAEQEAAAIVAAAKREAELFAADAHQKTEDYVARRTALAEQKIGQAERDAISEVRASAVDIAVEAARALLAAKVDAKAGADLFKASLADVKAKLN